MFRTLMQFKKRCDESLYTVLERTIPEMRPAHMDIPGFHFIAETLKMEYPKQSDTFRSLVPKDHPLLPLYIQLARIPYQAIKFTSSVTSLKGPKFALYKLRGLLTKELDPFC